MIESPNAAYYQFVVVSLTSLHIIYFILFLLNKRSVFHGFVFGLMLSYTFFIKTLLLEDYLPFSFVSLLIFIVQLMLFVQTYNVCEKCKT